MNKNALETDLIKKCRAGDTGAFGELINFYRKSLFTYLLRMCRDKMTAEDLFQDTLLKIWKAMEHYNEQQKFSSWIFTIAHNVSIDTFRTKKLRHRIAYLNEDSEVVSEVTPHTEMVALESKVTFEKAVENLPDEQRRVFLLRQHSGMTFKEIAATMNQPINTVLSHMHYAVKKLRKMLKNNDE